MLLAQVLVDPDQLVVALQSSTLKGLATRTAECVPNGTPIIAVEVLQDDNRLLHMGFDRFGKEQMCKV